MARIGVLAVVVLAAAATLGLGDVSTAKAIALTQAEAPLALQTAAPHVGGAGDVADADTAGKPVESTGPSPVLLLVAALGVLVGVLLITRPGRRSSDEASGAADPEDQD